MPVPTAKDIYENWKSLYADHLRMGELVLELMAHPDTKPEDITRVKARYTAHVQGMRETKESVIAVLETKYKAPAFLFSYADKVRGDKV